MTQLLVAIPVFSLAGFVGYNLIMGLLDLVAFHLNGGERPKR